MIISQDLLSAKLFLTKLAESFSDVVKKITLFLCKALKKRGFIDCNLELC